MDEGRDWPRVLLVAPAIDGGGAENRCRMVVENLFGGVTGVAVFRGRKVGASYARQAYVDLGWRGCFSYPVMITRLHQFLRRHRFDAVIAFGMYPNLVAWGATRRLCQGPALILTEINSPWREYLEVRGTLRAAVLHVLRKLILRRADVFAANSEDGLKESVYYYGVDPERARRIPNLVEPERLTRLAAERPADDQPSGALSICIVGRLFRRKRVDTLLHAAAHLPDDLPWRIDVVGHGEERGPLEALARELGIAARVRFQGWQENPYPFLARAAVFVLCSEFEGFPNVVLEAMVLGVPVVTSLNTTDAKDMVAQRAALGFPIGNHEALGAHVAWLLSKEALRKELCRNATSYAERHVLPGAIKEYEALVLDAIAQRRKGS